VNCRAVVSCACLCQALIQPVVAEVAEVAEMPSGADDYVFDTRMFRGGTLSNALLDRLNRRMAVLPGTYGVNVWVNQKFGARLDVTFREDGDGRVAPCLTPQQFDRLGIVPPVDGAQHGAQQLAREAARAQADVFAQQGTQQAVRDCLDVVEYAPGTRVDVRMDALRLDLQVPQAWTRRIPRGTVNPADLDAGITVGFVNYMGNYYHTWPTLGARQQSAYLSLHGGLNLGLWQLRQRSIVQWSPRAGARYKSVRTYVQRPLLDIGSQLTLGQTYTGGRFFSGLNYVGASLRMDERMLPDSQRGYAPVVRGVANSNARVSILQNGVEIYQKTVAPGPFEIADLYPNSYGGDLDVEVLEADGTVVRYTVPFAAVPESLREGRWHYEASLGRTHHVGEDSVFGDLVVQRGMSNAVTLYGGLRLAQGYRAAMAGGVYASGFGALGADLTYSRARLPGRAAADTPTTPTTASGWMMRLSWSNTIAATGTTVTLANYHYSTTGYQDLANVLGTRRNGAVWTSATHSRRNRFDVRMHQQLGRFGHLFTSGSVQDYHNGKARDVQYQLGYGTALPNGIGMNAVLMRQHKRRAGAGDFGRRRDTALMVSLAIPLGRATRAPALNATMTMGSGADSDAKIQSGFSSALDSAQTLTYSLGGSYGRNTRQTAVNGNLQKRFSAVSVGVGASHSRHTRQVSANVQGALALHAGGMTFGPYVSDTFALVQAHGATGAKLLNSQTRIDGNGYALVPAMTPYRYNRVLLDPDGMAVSVELVESERRSAPYAGAVVQLTFQTRPGQAMLIHAVQDNGLPVPFGAEVFDAVGAAVGMAGQGGRIYVRAKEDAGALAVRWGDAPSEQCVVPYRFDPQTARDLPLVRLQGVCGHGMVQVG